ncbi:hypothetical protein B0H13DRAFT_1895498 [Mycena leptocephala]|nr:hypothetical protein B0H13DRAFT_1895498 [Mycena leptocephala]
MLLPSASRVASMLTQVFKKRDDRNRKTRERMRRLRAKQALDLPQVKQEQLEAKRAAQERNRALLAHKSRTHRRSLSYRRRNVITRASRQAARERAALEVAVAGLEPRNSSLDGSLENSDDNSDSSSDSDTFSPSAGEDDGDDE